MTDDEFKAPEWVGGEDGVRPVSKKQQRAFLAVAAIAIPFCLWAGWFEFGRAQGGNWRAWVYTFEWPFFAAVIIWMYRKFARGEKIQIPRPNLEELRSNNEDNDE